ncbi:glycerol-3-phosphate 1-O-acyltransferase PlsB [Agaribacter flavus]|uniref:Glycerol-3-phosphate acyltransferase n=1 Tax=Agaribacter flavus TaxID=1902781 RepID=A0ABV7FT90_9ALTE
MSSIRTAFRWIFSKTIGWLVSVKSVPADVESELGIDTRKPILFLLQTESFTDQLALDKSTKALGLPSPHDIIEVAGTLQKRRYFLERPQSILTRKVEKTAIEDIFTELFHIHRVNPDLDLQVVPVFITWGRSAGKENSGFAQLLASKASPNWLRKAFIVLFFGRDNFVSYSPAVSTRQLADLHGSDKQIAQKLVRVARTHFQRKRQTLSGPTLLERATLYNSILGSEAVKNALHDEVKQRGISSDKAKKTALSYIDEIAADYREGLIRMGDRVLTRIWNKIYDGIDVSHAERVRELAQNGHEIIYVPCHRSHMDYLLLTYVIYHEGLVTPHIAAGINLNFWPAGPIFRRGGAFFLRRSFGGNKLYTAVFREYLELLFNKGYSVKYFPEGGRSRTGRLLPPKTGMLAMTLQALTKGVNRPVSIVPVYIGYEHVMEVKSYMKELRGKNKKKESTTQVFSAIRKLKNYGHGFVNFGDPIQIGQFLDEAESEWRQQQDANDKKPKWLTPVVNKLADSVMTRINRASAINGTAILALSLLSSKTHVMSKKELTQAIEDYLALFSAVPYSDDSTLPKETAQQLVDRTLALNRFKQYDDKYGTMVSPKENAAVYLTFYRNNIIHMFSIPSLVLAAVFSAQYTQKSQVLSLVETLFPLLKREFFMHHSSQEALDYAEALLDYFVKHAFLLDKNGQLSPPEATSKRFHTAWLLSRTMQETWQRYAVVLRVLEIEQTIGRAQLERQSVTVAERLSALFGLHSPEFYDKNVLSTFVNALRENELLQCQEDGSLAFSEQSLSLKNALTPLIWPEVVQHLEQIERE